MTWIMANALLVWSSHSYLTRIKSAADSKPPSFSVLFHGVRFRIWCGYSCLFLRRQAVIFWAGTCLVFEVRRATVPINSWRCCASSHLKTITRPRWSTDERYDRGHSHPRESTLTQGAPLSLERRHTVVKIAGDEINKKRKGKLCINIRHVAETCKSGGLPHWR